MRLTKWCIIASAAILTASLAGCYTPHSSTVWTPEKAKAAILKQEHSRVMVRGNISPELLVVTDDYFDNFYCARSQSTRQGDMIMTTRWYSTRKIFFHDIKDAQIRWDAGQSLIGLALLFGVRGPFVYYRILTLESGEKVFLEGTPKGDLWNWAWLWVVPVRPFLHSDPYTEAILYMSNRARQTRAEPSAE